MKSVVIAEAEAAARVYGQSEMETIRSLTELAPASFLERLQVQRNPEILEDIDVIFGTWGMPVLSEEILAAAPNLKAIFYAAGTVKSFVTDAVWKRGITVSSASSANALPVAEFCLAQILFSLKLGWRQMRNNWREQQWTTESKIPGIFEAQIGLISMGVVARRLVELLKPFKFHIQVYCPFLTCEEASRMGVKLVSLEEIFRESDVVSVHTPLLPETTGMINGRYFRMMKKNATFINTSRGAIVRECEMVESLRERPDITALLDVTDPEPPVPKSGIFQVPNIYLTSHTAGAVGSECRRLARFAIAECERYLTGKPLQGVVNADALQYIA
jgi:phosphoglycerate dehydrogenase-like enzyme